MTALFYNLILLTQQASDNVPPPNGDPPPPAPGLPIDDHIWVLLAAGLLFGVYILYKRNQATNKAS
ncbi:PID-CTERM protein-sorting domain-containing protein [Aequorivita marina]|uniref:PID-CTERM protein-sorting domain-containing protein n=1 Tax=Aequorivita marina TaxID=3073654 RepID=UPI002875F2D1|nr:hypothetical protein [Aequorivita sp. S2608]MDS1298959.1 hypothetical protein [Aequorivita sp. S2608]